MMDAPNLGDLAGRWPIVHGTLVLMLHVNIPTLGGESQVPFGGTKASGLGAHECGEAGFDFFTEEQIVYVAG